MTVGVLEFFLILPRVVTGVARWCVLVVSLTDGLVHEEYCLKLIEDMLTLSDEENSTCFQKLIHSLVVVPGLFLEFVVYSDALSE